MVCGTCNEACVNPKDSVKCADCSSEFHIGCSKIRSTKFAKMTPQDIAAWRCSSCKQEVASVASQPDTEDSTLFELLRGIKIDMTKNSQETRDGFASLKLDVANVNTTLNKLESKLSSLETENSALKTQCEDLKQENIQLSKQVQSLQSDMSEIQQYTRSNNIEIKGVPLTANENIYSLLNTVANVLNINHNSAEVSIAHRLQQTKDRSLPPSIVVQFVSRYTRNEWLAAARKKRLQTTDLSMTFTPAPVYINEHLTKENKALLGKSKFLVRKTKLHAAWTRNGAIHIKRSSESRTQRVTSLAEVCDIAGVPLTWTGEDTASATTV